MFFEDFYDSRVGPLIPVTVGNEYGPERIKVEALVDTGSTYCGITPPIVSALGLPVLDRDEVGTPSGGGEFDIHFITVTLPNSDSPAAAVGAFCFPELRRYKMLLGRNVIRLGLLTITGDRFSFKVPL